MARPISQHLGERDEGVCVFAVGLGGKQGPQQTWPCMCAAESTVLACPAKHVLSMYACLQAGAGAAPIADTHHTSHPPGVHSRGGGGGRKLGESARFCTQLAPTSVSAEHLIFAVILGSPSTHPCAALS